MLDPKAIATELERLIAVARQARLDYLAAQYVQREAHLVRVMEILKVEPEHLTEGGIEVLGTLLAGLR